MLLAGALLRRSVLAAVALLLPAVVWLNLFGGLLTDKSHPGGDLTVVSHNVGADNPDAVGTARALAASGADLLALEELDPAARRTYEKELATSTPITRCWARSGCGAGCRCRTPGRSTSRWTRGHWERRSPPTSSWSTTGGCAPRWPRTTGPWRCTWRTSDPYG
ncbi:hypothetical protein SPW_3003 [Streptomyces sp. W007]|nr:hypothetical protein SPW_3003 [Streptomyces sp. W007]